MLFAISTISHRQILAPPPAQSQNIYIYFHFFDSVKSPRLSTKITDLFHPLNTVSPASFNTPSHLRAKPSRAKHLTPNRLIQSSLSPSPASPLYPRQFKSVHPPPPDEANPIRKSALASIIQLKASPDRHWSSRRSNAQTSTRSVGYARRLPPPPSCFLRLGSSAPSSQPPLISFKQRQA